LKKQLDEVAESLGARDLEKVLTFAEFVRARRVARNFSASKEAPSAPSDDDASKLVAEESATDFEPPSSQQRAASRV